MYRRGSPSDILNFYYFCYYHNFCSNDSSPIVLSVRKHRYGIATAIPAASSITRDNCRNGIRDIAYGMVYLSESASLLPIVGFWFFTHCLSRTNLALCIHNSFISSSMPTLDNTSCIRICFPLRLNSGALFRFPIIVPVLAMGFGHTLKTHWSPQNLFRLGPVASTPVEGQGRRLLEHIQ